MQPFCQQTIETVQRSLGCFKYMVSSVKNQQHHPQSTALQQICPDPFHPHKQHYSQAKKRDSEEQDRQKGLHFQYLSVLSPPRRLQWLFRDSSQKADYFQSSYSPLAMVKSSKIHIKDTVVSRMAEAISQGVERLVYSNCSRTVLPVCQLSGKMTSLPGLKVWLKITIRYQQLLYSVQQPIPSPSSALLNLLDNLQACLLPTLFLVVLIIAIQTLQEMSQPPKLKSTIHTETDEWGRKKYRIEQRSESEEEQEKPVIAQGEGGLQRSLLVGREQDLNIEKYVGRIEKNKKSKKKEVFFCEVCNEGFKCDMAYITHLNSPYHNRKLGMSMKVKAVSTQAVVQKLKSMKDKHQSPEDREMARFHKNAFVNKYLAKEEENEKLEEADQDDALKEGQEEEEEEQDPVQAEMRALGLPTAFGSKKQKR